MTSTQPTKFQPVQLPSGQWRILNTETGQHHGQAVRHEHEAASRARRLEQMYS